MILNLFSNNEKGKGNGRTRGIPKPPPSNGANLYSYTPYTTY